MGLFGDIDTTEVPDDPFFVAAGTYGSVLAEAVKKESNDGERVGLSFRWVIEEECEFEGKNISDWLAIFPDASWSDLTNSQKSQASNTKKRLLELGVSEDEMDGLLEADNLSELVGLTADVTVKNTTDKNDADKKYTNITKVTLT